MILGFKQYFPWGEPTHFREKILFNVQKPQLITIKELDDTNKTLNPIGLKDLRLVVPITHPKLHTLREDKHDRWKAGMSIQMVYRGKNYSIQDHFNKGIPELEKCVSVQKVDIIIIPNSHIRILIGHLPSIKEFRLPLRDNFEVSPEGLQFVQNDGFNNVFDFAKWFNKDWSGKIIHFTNLRY